MPDDDRTFKDDLVEVVDRADFGAPKRRSVRLQPARSPFVHYYGLVAVVALLAFAGFVAFGDDNQESRQPVATLGDPTLPDADSERTDPRSTPLAVSGDAANERSVVVEGIPLSFTVPADGWGSYGSLLFSKSDHGPQGAEAVVFWAGFPDGTDADPCGFADGRPTREPADVANAVATASGVDLTSPPSPATVGGYPAAHVQVVVREDDGCDPGFFYNWKAATDGPMWVTTQLGDTIDVWIVDVAGTRLFIAGEAHPDAATDVRREVQEIVTSIRFDP